MKRCSIALAVCLGMGLTLLPSGAYAGDKEWATAGKILTGAAVLGALHHHVQPRHNHRIVEHRRPNLHSRYKRWTSRRSNHHRRPSAVHPAAVTACTDPIIVNLSSGKRLYQPRIKGHVAYVQKWSACDSGWTTIGYRASIWQ